MAHIPIRIGELIAPDGTRLHLVEHSLVHPMGTVLLVHGLGEHSGRYGHVIEVLNRSGMSVVQVDHRGHGLSTGQRGHIASYENYLDDLTLVLEHIVTEAPEQKIVLYGHSMGGGIVANWSLRRMTEQWKEQILGVILSSPWFRLTKSPGQLKLSLIHYLSRIYPTLDIPTKMRVRDLCRAQDAIERFEKDALNHQRITVSTAWECYQAGHWALANAANFPVPILAIHGSADRITSPEATRQFCAKIPDSRFVPLENLIHEPHHDPKWREVVYHVTEWTLKRFNVADAA